MIMGVYDYYVGIVGLGFEFDVFGDFFVGVFLVDVIEGGVFDVVCFDFFVGFGQDVIGGFQCGFVQWFGVVVYCVVGKVVQWVVDDGDDVQFVVVEVGQFDGFFQGVVGDWVVVYGYQNVIVYKVFFQSECLFVGCF